MISKQKDEKG